MKGLLLKDILNLKQQGKIYLLIMAVWLLISFMNGGIEFFTGVMIMFTIFIPISALTYDERAKWDKFAITIPVSRNDIVLSKYILGVICAVSSFIISIIIGVILSTEIKELIFTNIIAGALGIIFFSIVLPFIYKFGTEKGRLIMMVVLVIPSLLVVIFSRINVSMTDLVKNINISIPEEKIIMYLAILALVISIISFFVSMLISKSIYSKKEF